MSTGKATVRIHRTENSKFGNGEVNKSMLSSTKILLEEFGRKTIGLAYDSDDGEADFAELIEDYATMFLGLHLGASMETLSTVFSLLLDEED